MHFNLGLPQIKIQCKKNYVQAIKRYRKWSEMKGITAIQKLLMIHCGIPFLLETLLPQLYLGASGRSDSLGGQEIEVIIRQCLKKTYWEAEKQWETEWGVLFAGLLAKIWGQNWDRRILSSYLIWLTRCQLLKPLSMVPTLCIK